MADNSPLADGLDRKEILAAAHRTLSRAYRRLDAVISHNESVDAAELQPVSRHIADLDRSVRLLLDRISWAEDEYLKQEAKSDDSELDLEGARSEIERRLARIAGQIVAAGFPDEA